MGSKHFPSWPIQTWKYSLWAQYENKLPLNKVLFLSKAENTTQTTPSEQESCPERKWEVSKAKARAEYRSVHLWAHRKDTHPHRVNLLGCNGDRVSTADAANGINQDIALGRLETGMKLSRFHNPPPPTLEAHKNHLSTQKAARLP